MALQIATKVIKKVKREEHLPDDWEQLKPLLIHRKTEPSIQSLLNAYATSGLVLAELGETEQAQTIASRVQEVDRTAADQAATIWANLTQGVEE